jgi:WD40 associated region in TFIID subunit, NTD2 domain
MASKQAKAANNQAVPGENERLPQMAPHSAEACQVGFERVAAWVDSSLDMYKPELAQVCVNLS